MRAFFAINLSSEIKDLLEDVILRLDKLNLRSDIKWVNKDNLHLTLAFIENLAEEKLANIIEEVDKLPKPDFWLVQLGDIGYFPSSGKVKVMKMSLLGDIEKIVVFQNKIKQILKKEGITFDEKDFAPHLTLGRIKDQRGPLSKFVVYDKLSFPVTEFDLIRSDLNKQGNRYEVLKKFK
ncbi:MAG: RNA 2',3'-cyclic phosphodiesterase [Patescibacteria group bacterium]